MKKVLLSWSSGKDSSWTLKLLLDDPNVEVVGLFTTINQEAERVAMHGVREQLLKMQADSIGLPLDIIKLPWPCSNEDYQRIMGDFIKEMKKKEVDAVAFGDLFLEDIKQYRLDQMKGTGFEVLFPAWGLPTDQLAQDMIKSGIKTVLTCVDSKQIDPSFAGRQFDQSLLDGLPEHADPCGENGEFHTFVYDAPFMKHAIPISVGEVINRDGFYYADVLPK